MRIKSVPLFVLVGAITTSCISTNVKMLKPNFEKVDVSKVLMVAPIKRLSFATSERLYTELIVPLSANTIATSFTPALEWEFTRLGVNLHDTATYKKLYAAGFSYLLVIDVLEEVDDVDYDYITSDQLAQRYQVNKDPLIPEEDDLRKFVRLKLKLYSMRTNNLIYMSEAYAQSHGFTLPIDSEGSHKVDLSTIERCYEKSINKGLIRLYNDCGIYQKPVKK